MAARSKVLRKNHSYILVYILFICGVLLISNDRLWGNIIKWIVLVFYSYMLGKLLFFKLKLAEEKYSKLVYYGMLTNKTITDIYKIKFQKHWIDICYKTNKIHRIYFSEAKSREELIEFFKTFANKYGYE